jgi:tripartite motif-containing protein 2/3/tripartite motif-containing protein 71
MKLDLYCETCEELICLHCTVNKHARPEHKYDLVVDTFEKHKVEITASLEPIEKHLGVASKELEQFDLRSRELDDLQVALEADIYQQIWQLQELLQARKAELVGQVRQHIETKKKNLAAQKDEVETVHTQLASCLSFVRESLRTGSQGEVMKIKKMVVKQIKEITSTFKPDMLPPCEPPNVRFKSSRDLTQSCQQFGEVYLQFASPGKCYAAGKGLKVAKVGEAATAILQLVDSKGMACTQIMKTPTCELVPENSCETVDCSVKKIEDKQYEISYQPTSRGRHQLHIKVEGKHIKGSPFLVTVKLPIKKLGTPIKTISGLKGPWGVTLNQRMEIVVVESGGHCVSIFGQAGEKISTFGSQGSGLLWYPHGVIVDIDGNILVVDNNNCCIQKFSSDGKFIAAVGMKGDKKLEFYWPRGIGIHPHTRKIYVADQCNHRIQILNPDLTFSSSFGSRGSLDGQFQYPLDVAFDSIGNVYVTDNNNHCIQEFTSEGEFLLKFGKRGSCNGQLNCPSSISISSDDVVYVAETSNHRVSVFTCEGKFLSSFGSKGSGPGQFSRPRGVMVDKDGNIYVSDADNGRLQIF